MKSTLDYLHFAENDYQYFIHSYNRGDVANAMANIAQSICERYLKHIIAVYVKPNPDDKNAYQKNADVLHTHSLMKLWNYLREVLPDFEVDRKKLKGGDGYYFTSRYPGSESFDVTCSDIEECREAVEECRNKVLAYLKECEE
ncbi:hypothetical protein FACS1894111_12920 [Clostridia bacterium]|nr:hypothetical protein FACS1894111_12920 [Clostridia bacterium]